MGFSQKVGSARSHSGQGQFRVGWGGGRHDDAVDARRQQLLHRIGWCGTVFGGDRGDNVRPLVGDHQSVDTLEAAEGVGVERADAAQSDNAERGHGVLRSSWSRSATSSSSAVRSSASAASTMSTWLGGARLPIGWSRSRLVGKGVALGGRHHGIEQVALRAARGLHGAQRGIHRPHHRGAVKRLHRPAERRRDLQQVGHPADVGRPVGPRTVIQRRVEEHRVTLAQRHLHVVLGEEVDELGPVERDIPADEALRVGQEHGRAALDRHVAVRHRALQRQCRRHAVQMRGIRGQVLDGRRSRGGSRGVEPAASHRD